MVTVEKLGGSWVIVRGDDLCFAGESRNPAAAEEDAIRLFWTCDRWIPQFGLVKQFFAKRDAEVYLTQRRDRFN
jgi:hypothetical protein